jgi:hypothetical protein
MYLSSLFLAKRSKVVPERKSLSCSLRLGMRAPDYEIEKRLWINEHYEGGYLFQDTVVVSVVPPDHGAGTWAVACAWQGSGIAEPTNALLVKPLLDGRVQVEIPFDSCAVNSLGSRQPSSPGVRGKIRLVFESWN